MTYSNDDCISALHEAKSILGHSPSWTEYGSLDINGPSRGTIQNRFNGWDSAKDAADMDRVTRSKPIGDIPDNVDVNREKWESFTSDRRHKLRRRAEWSKEKVRRGCNECGYDEHPSALDWHHQGEKDMSVATLIGHGYSNERISEEVEKCVVLCANCHRLKKETYITND
jgi:hypothetical protein